MNVALNPRSTPPAADTFVFDPDLAVEGRRGFVPRYGDEGWSLLALTQNPSQADDIIRWRWFPEVFKEPFRYASFTVINYPLPDTDVARHGAAMRSKLSVGRILKTVNQWSLFAQWLDARGIRELSQVTAEDLTDYSRHLAKARALARNTATSHLIGLSRLHYYGRIYLPETDRLIEPPWVAEGMDDYLPPATPLGENVTEPIAAATMGPLLVWALRFVEEYAEDILTACAEHRRLVAVAEALKGPIRPGAGQRLVSYLEQLVAEGKPVPASVWNKEVATPGVFLAGWTGTPVAKVHQVMNQPRWKAYKTQHPGRCLLDTPVTARLGGQPWHEPFDFYGTTTLVNYLVTACFIVLGYLTGMRTGEILALENGCCPDPEGPNEAARRHLIYARQFKVARDEDGNHDSAGVVREAPWVAVPQVVTAVRVLEQLGGHGLLFAAELHDPRQSERRSGRSLAIATMSNRIEAFIDWVNTHAHSRGRQAEAIPADTHGRVGTGRFRRTLAWHIARRPGGLVALAVQYGHMRTLISEGYGSRSRGGIHDLLDFETARNVAEHLSEVHEALQDGEGVSGPAARRLINAAAQEHHRFGGIIASVRQARSLLADPTLNVFENTEAFLFCNYDRSKALCHPGRRGKTQAPSLDRCKTNCANIARTDSHARQLREAADDLGRQAASKLVPEPLTDRLLERAQALADLADQHENDRIMAATGAEL
ncbi:integrase [Streptomyces scopuliridis]|uniref:integrase n=1 Tax=Streptomyces scopuliridis TaxID=452529 RepID=UPI002DDABF13|nr:integrase [Streptomyces scopuliridis]WSB35908.1 integrase [Streptomyces scopuliridis]